jgi:hypothetical protein
MREERYYHRINDIDIELEDQGSHKCIMIHEWSPDNSSRWGIAVFAYDYGSDYWYLRTYGNFKYNRIDWYDFGSLVNLGYKWIKEGCFTRYDERNNRLNSEEY